VQEDRCGLRGGRAEGGRYRGELCCRSRVSRGVRLFRSRRGRPQSLLSALPVPAGGTSRHSGLQPLEISGWGFATARASGIPASRRIPPRRGTAHISKFVHSFIRTYVQSEHGRPLRTFVTCESASTSPWHLTEYPRSYQLRALDYDPTIPLFGPQPTNMLTVKVL
jgi:hypothetical protein